ncbi:MAG: 4Fe-4S binding protein [Myxococcota bacterium]|nr:4Fe-4S binding protein [Myxococcota bacterium]
MKEVSTEKISCSAVAKGIAEPFSLGARPKALPVWDTDRCTRCALCNIYCPHGAVYRRPDSFFEAKRDLCTGCGICHRECWFGVISMAEEA